MTTSSSRPTSPAWLAAALVFASSLAVSCFIETSASTAFRFSCSDATECSDGESCMSGICQTSCTAATAADVCPIAGSRPMPCINGVCTSACTADNDHCSEPQVCTTLDQTTLLTLGIFGSDAVCMQACTPTSCAAGEACVNGVCFPAPGDDDGLPDTTGDTSTGSSGDGETQTGGDQQDDGATP